MIINVANDSDFSIYNIPFGIFSTEGTQPRAGVAIGDSIIDLHALGKLKVWDFDISVLETTCLNDFISLGKGVTSKVRSDIQAWLKEASSPLGLNKDILFVKQSNATMHMPVKIGDYTDFYSSIEHATNVGIMFRDLANALMPNWKHLPVGYHGRASSIIVSGQNIHRPKGQVMPKSATSPIYRPSARLDFELEMGFIIGKDSDLGSSVATCDAKDYIFGMVLFNDWSARDIQKWEYVPLGPFLGKSFASSVSPWIVTMEALEPFKVAGPDQYPEVLPYLQCQGDQNYNVNLEVGITPNGGRETVVCRSNFQYMYWNMAQQLAHHTINGCNIKIGDLMASGTISGKDEHAYGSMLELSWAGSKEIPLNDGVLRKFLEDGDVVSMRGYAESDGARVGFGEVRAEILPSK